MINEGIWRGLYPGFSITLLLAVPRLSIIMGVSEKVEIYFVNN